MLNFAFIGQIPESYKTSLFYKYIKCPERTPVNWKNIRNAIMGKVVAVCISEKKGTQKRDVGTCRLIEQFGLEGDAHAGKWHRQTSLLARESADIMREKGLKIKNGDFGENIVTEGIELKSLPIGTVLKIGDGITIRITQIGKLCHDRCAIYYTAGDCIMPREGIFAEILTGGTIKTGDVITLLEKATEREAKT